MPWNKEKTVNIKALEGNIGITNGTNRKKISQNTKSGNSTKTQILMWRELLYSFLKDFNSGPNKK